MFCCFEQRTVQILILFIFCSVHLFFHILRCGATRLGLVLNLCMCQRKKAIRLINKVDDRKHSKGLFIRSHAMKFKDLVDFKTLSVVCKDGNQLNTDRVCLYKDLGGGGVWGDPEK